MKSLTTIRLDPEEYKTIAYLSKKQGIKKSEVIRQTIHYGLLHLVNGRDENELIAHRLSKQTKDVDGKTFIDQLKKEFGL